MKIRKRVDIARVANSSRTRTLVELLAPGAESRPDWRRPFAGAAVEARIVKPR